VEYLTAVFHRETGTLREVFGPGYEPRRQQGEMTLAVEQALEREEGLVVEAPCGTGKSLAYLVPAAMHALRGTGSTLVATAHIALQEQLMDKDLPTVARALSAYGTLDYVLMKGKSNYLCPLQVETMQKASLSFEFADQDAAEAQAVLDWADATETGDKSDLPFIPRPAVWSRFCVGGEECLGKRCKKLQQGFCFLYKARERAAKAHVIVTNHHLLLTDMASGNQVLPPYQNLIVDEGHELVHVARESLGFSITAGRIKRLMQWLSKLRKQEQERDLQIAARIYFGQVKNYALSDKYSIRLRAAPPVDPVKLLAALEDAEAAAGTAWTNTNNPIAVIAQTLAQRLGQELSAFSAVEDGERFVYYIEQHGDRDVSLESRALDPAPMLMRGLFEPASAYVLTSATLSAAGDFTFVRNSTGIPAGARELALSSPFDFMSRARFVVPASVPPSDREFPKAVAEELLRLIDVAPGGVLALFTSWKNMETVVSTLRKRTRTNVRLLVQGDAPRSKLIEEFRAARYSVLCGVASFWQGIDVPGEALVAVLMDKLPFPSPGEPLVDAIHERLGRNSFFQYDLPVACIRVQQGAGRLIRSTTDYGAIILMDPRVFTKGYGRKILASLPPMPILRTTEPLPDFFAEMQGGGDAR